MRDFRNAKAMAHTLRSTLATQGHKITNSQSLELIAKAFGVADWNTLSAAIRAEPGGSRKSQDAPSVQPAEIIPSPRLHPALEETFQRALAHASERKHRYATLEHLLFALTDDADASSVMNSCNVDRGKLRQDLTKYVDNGLSDLVIDDSPASRATPAFLRVIQRGQHEAQQLGRTTVSGAELLLGILSKSLSPAAQLLRSQRISRQEVLSFIARSRPSEGNAASG